MGRSGGPDLTEIRTLIGRGSRVWMGQGRQVVEEDWWATLSGVQNVDYNVVCWHGSDPDIAHGLQMLAGASLGAAQRLVDADWVCAGFVPVVYFDLSHFVAGPPDPGVQLLTEDRVEEVRALVSETFTVPEEVSRAKVPSYGADPAFQVWTLVEEDEVRSAVATMIVGRALIGWSMATPVRFQRRGLGRRLIQGATSAAAANGVEWIGGYASTQGAPLYRQLGWQTVDHWQVWSRPRWVLGRV
jgi:GNAT superfamily N-acetyltransferase